MSSIRPSFYGLYRLNVMS
ncbi:hypothetical protein F383_07431 [Gossypium arboreum]|uniref:Uncharacterized protein n=1 Tax=Gossypium arboreum TaxID=29729 RepID=A0A0B0NTL2_GOSAR|nr:hypothetical protein F383_07431 [Gossypium arboreum]